MSYHDDVKEHALQLLLNCQLAYDSLKYIINSQYGVSHTHEIVTKYDIYAKLSGFKSFLDNHHRKAFLDFTETHVFEKCIERCEEIIGEIELYNAYLFGEKSFYKKEVDIPTGYIFAPYIPVYQNSLPVQSNPAPIRKLKARWTQEAIQDLQNMHDINFDMPLHSDIILIPWTKE
jgi:hypothetical protein